MPVIGLLRGNGRHPDGLPDFTWAWLEAPLAARLATTAEVEDWDDLRRWPEGRIFDEAGEYRWCRTGDGLHGVLLLENDPLPDGFEQPLDLKTLEDSALLLHGEWVDPDEDPQGNPDRGARFYAPEIPRVQRYPVELGEPPHANKSARLLVRRYRDAAGKKGEFLRCVGLDVIRQEVPDG